MKRLISFSLAIGLLFPFSTWALDEEAQAAKQEGMRLYGIRQVETAIPYLEQTAQAGDVEAMYYLGEVSRRLVMGGMSQAARPPCMATRMPCCASTMVAPASWQPRASIINASIAWRARPRQA